VTLLRAFAFTAIFCLSGPAFAQGTKVAFGTIQQDTTAPVEVSADELNVDQETGEAIFTGNVVIVQGDMRLSAARVLVLYRQDLAESQRADYDIDTGVIVMTGNVLMAQGNNAISSDRMTVDLDGGTARMEGRVKTILQTGID
jgi:lipopolysaccharide export system protein LptA